MVVEMTRSNFLSNEVFCFVKIQKTGKSILFYLLTKKKLIKTDISVCET